MKKLLIAFFILTGFIVKSQTIKVLDDAYGFRKLHFEDSASKYPSLKAVFYSKDSSFISYKKTDEDSVINGAKVEIVYTFFKGQLSNVYIGTNDSLSSRKVLKSLLKLYGTGKKDDPYIEKYYWYGSKVMLTYIEDVNTFNARVYMNSIRMKLKSEGR